MEKIIIPKETTTIKELKIDRNCKYEITIEFYDDETFNQLLKLHQKSNGRLGEFQGEIIIK